MLQVFIFFHLIPLFNSRIAFWKSNYYYFWSAFDEFFLRFIKPIDYYRGECNRNWSISNYKIIFDIAGHHCYLDNEQILKLRERHYCIQLYPIASSVNLIMALTIVYLRSCTQTFPMKLFSQIQVLLDKWWFYATVGRRLTFEKSECHRI